MQFTVAALFALVAVTSAYSVAEHNEFIKRQANNIQNMDPSIPAMTNAKGDVVPFDSANVYLDSVAKGI
ncbi:hypothetical protein GQ53DRAFT_826303 [Thozetella sp. PMI_491]|nr:hypothetical protein GQ53DRAFT_826303 [Thozetella sp. PMI_491]